MQGERKYLWAIHTLNVTSSWFDKTWERRSEICQLHRDPGSSLQGTALVPNYPCYANLLPKRPAFSCAWGLRGPHLLPRSHSPPAGPAQHPAAREGARAAYAGGAGWGVPGGDITQGSCLVPVLGFAKKRKKRGDFTLRFSPSSLGKYSPELGMF